MCVLISKAAPWMLLLFLLVWPQIARSLALSEDVIEDGASLSILSEHEHQRQTFGGVPEIVEYNSETNVLRFKISCIDCSHENKEQLANEVISIQVIPNNARSCRNTDAIGLKVNGRQLESQSLFPSIPQSAQVSLSDHHTENSIFDLVRWINICGCTNRAFGEECGDDEFESVFVLELLGIPGTSPGFTLSYKQHGSGALLRISDFPDTALFRHPMIGHSSHWLSPPLLELQKGSVPTSTLFSSFSSVFPSFTTSAANAESTWTTSHVPTVTDPPLPTASSARALPLPASQEPEPPSPEPYSAPALTVQGQGDWRHSLKTFSTIAAFEHSLSMLRSKAKNAAQSIVTSLHGMHHCSKEAAPQHIKMLGEPQHLPSATPSNTARATIPTASSISQPSVHGFSNPPPSRHVTTRQAVRAFQITALITIILALCAAMFALVRRNPRLRAEIAARNEERRNIRLFRKAACRYRWRNMLNRFKWATALGRFRAVEHSGDEVLPSTNLDNGIDWDEWHEKRIVAQEGAVTTNTAGVREGLLEFRKAHRLVDGMVTAEEGRYGISGRTTRHQRSWSGSTGSEKTAPPPYEEEEDFVVDGIRYVRRVTDTTPDSSVIDTSPRSSVADSDSESEKD